MAFIWFGLFFGFRINHLESQLLEKEHRIYLATVLIYPIVETCIKWGIEKNVVPNSWLVLNRIEHFLGAIAMTLIFLPTYTEFWKKLRWWQALTYIIGLICIMGNLNEFFEYFVRRQRFNVLEPYQIALYYWDTIYDQIMNFLGGFIGFGILKWNDRQ